MAATLAAGRHDVGCRSSFPSAWRLVTLLAMTRFRFAFGRASARALVAAVAAAFDASGCGGDATTTARTERLGGQVRGDGATDGGRGVRQTASM
jgi:hypothetical protein